MQVAATQHATSRSGQHARQQDAQAFEPYPALVLNADFQPLSYLPLSLCSWQDAVTAVCRGKVNVIEAYDDCQIRWASGAMPMPSVIALKQYVPSKPYPAFTRFNVFLRDKFTCQYCGDKFCSKDLTFDHVIPKSKGGTSKWDNIVSVCVDCNVEKGNRLLKGSGMHLLNPPRQPSFYELQNSARGFPPRFLHETWRDYLYWDSQLDGGADPVTDVLSAKEQRKLLGVD